MKDSKLIEFPQPEHVVAAAEHVQSALESRSIAIGAAKGIIYSLIGTLGSLIGDPDLPNHLLSGYQDALELAYEVQAKIKAHEQSSK